MKPEWEEWARQAREEFPMARSALLPLLHRIQAAEGYLSDATLAEVATLLQLPVQEVVSTASFYTLFYRKPVGRKVIHVCTNLTCTLAGADRLMHALEGELGIREGQTTPDGQYTLFEAECLAACDKAPVVQVNLRYHGPVTPEQAPALLAGEVPELE